MTHPQNEMNFLNSLLQLDLTSVCMKSAGFVSWMSTAILNPPRRGGPHAASDKFAPDSPFKRIYLAGARAGRDGGPFSCPGMPGPAGIRHGTPRRRPKSSTGPGRGLLPALG